MMGAAYVVSGSVNQACTESGACEYTRQMLAKADMADVGMAPSADMFELGARVQVLKKGSLFAMRAQKLYELYNTYESWEDVPAVREELETKVFQRTFADIWQGTADFFKQRDPEQIEKAEQNPKKRWRWCSAGTWDCPRAGRATGWKSAAWITRSGADRPWARSTNGRAARTWKITKTGT